MASGTEVPAKDAWLVQQTGVKVDPNVRQDLETKPVVEKAKPKHFWSDWWSKDDSGE